MASRHAVKPKPKHRSHQSRKLSKSHHRRLVAVKARRSKSKSSSRSSRSKSRSGGKVRLVKLTKSPKKEKKYRAQFSDGTHTDFGAAGMSDFTKHKDESRRQRYLKRHAKRENWRNMKSPGALSRYILWNKPTLTASLADYRKRFN